MSKIVKFNGIVIDFKRNPKNTKQYITSVQTGIDVEGFAVVRDCFTKASMVCNVVPVTDEETGESTEQLIPSINRNDTVSVTISRHLEGEEYERNVKKGDKYVNAEGVETEALKAGTVVHKARTNGFNVMSINTIPADLLERATRLWG